MGDVRLAVLVSGSGTILEAMLARGIAVNLVVSDRSCRALQVGEQHGLTSILVDRALYGGFSKAFDRQAYTDALSGVLTTSDIDLVAMAGFGTITAASFYDRYRGRVLNTHPSLLPDFKGWHAVRLALEARASESGCTVHIATEALDEGPILAQARVNVLANDDEASLHERIKQVERELYPEVIAAVIEAMARGESPSSIAKLV